jgi:hypothetical protein
MRKLYYIVEKELQQVDDLEETTGFKTVTVYTIENNVPTKFFSLDISKPIDLNVHTDKDTEDIMAALKPYLAE